MLDYRIQSFSNMRRQNMVMYNTVILELDSDAQNSPVLITVQHTVCSYNYTKLHQYMSVSSIDHLTTVRSVTYCEKVGGR